MVQKAYIVIVILFFYNSTVQAQKEIEFNFEAKTWNSNISDGNISRGDFFRIKITNINLNLWKINFKSKDTTITKELKVPTFESINISSLSTLVSSFQNNLSLVAKDSITGEYFHKKVGSMQNVDGFDIGCEVAFDVFKSEVLNLEENTIPQFDLIVNNFRKLVSDIRKERWAYLKEDLETQDLSYIKIINEIENINKSLTEIHTEITLNQNSYKRLLGGLKEESPCLEKNKIFKKKVVEYITILEGFKTKIKEIESQITPEKVDELIKSIFFLTNQREYISLPIQFLGEQTKVSLNFEPRSPDYNLNSTTTSILVPNFSNSGNWSVGTSFFVSSLKNEEFSVIGTQDGEETSFQVFEEKSDDYEIGLATLVRYGKKLNQNFGYHLNFGPGVNIGKNIRPRLLFGLGMSLGKKNHLSLDIGGIAGYVDTRSNGIDLNQIYSVSPEKTTVTKLDIGYFIGLGYFFNL